MRRQLLVLVAGIMVACGVPEARGPIVEPVAFSETEEACLDFYRSAQESVVEESIYLRAFADRIEALGHDAAAVVLSDLADQWEVGVWEASAEEPEVSMSRQFAKAGALLGEVGATRCIDLAEWWGIREYEGEPDPDEILERQAEIWAANGLADYYLLVAGGDPTEGHLTQLQVRVKQGEVDSVTEVEVGSLDGDHLPKTVDEIYERLLDERPSVDGYDLVLALPRYIVFSDGTTLYVRANLDGYPRPLEYYDEEKPVDVDKTGAQGRASVIGRLDCSPGYVQEARNPDTGQDPLDIAKDADPRVASIEPLVPLWYSGLDAEGTVIVELALGDAPGAGYQVWTCES